MVAVASTKLLHILQEGSVHLFARGPRPHLEYLPDECLLRKMGNLSPCFVLSLQTYADVRT